jgi:hypothetical protein
MRKFVLSMIVFLLVFISFSCEENFSPKTEFIQQYALFCIVSGDTSYQYAFIEKSYNVQGLDPSGYNSNTFVKNAEIKIKYNNVEYILKDSSSLINGKEFDFYFTDSLKPDPNKLMEISAILEDGKTLTGSTITPKSGNLSFQYEDITSDTYIEQKNEGLFFIWHISGTDTTGILYLPKLEINYYKMENGTNVYHQKEVPVSYFRNGDQFLPNYPIVTSDMTLTYEMDAINRAMNEISEGDPDKSAYTIIDANFELLLLDNNLAPYYLTIQTFLDGFTVILDQQDYSNIDGGFGVFGSFFKRVLHLSLSRNYVLGFGYRLAN